MKNFILLGSLFGALPTLASATDADIVGQCSRAALGYLSALDETQQEQANWPFAGKERRKWTYFPNVPELDIRSEGLSIKAMNSAQRIAAHKLIECGLSEQGYQKAVGIMRLDDILGQTDLFRPKKPGDEAPVDAEKYWLAVFGDPGAGEDEPWGWQLEGHHLALNFTSVGNEVIYAPTFMGADPARVTSGRYAGWRLLGDEVDRAIALALSLKPEQRRKAILAESIPERLFTSPGREDALKDFSGIASTDLNDGQLRLLRALIETYVENAAEPIAAKHLQAIERELAANTWFAWMGPIDADQGIYYRVHSPALLIEFVTARNRQSKEREPNPNHVHSIFAYPGNNYGDDLLKRHYATSPDHAHE